MKNLGYQLKRLEDWNLNYVLSLTAEEYDWIDFKASDWLTSKGECLDSFSKYLSAWANYEGGYLVIGVKDCEGSEITLDEGVDFSLKGGVKDWLESKLPGLVEDPLQRITVRTFEKELGTSRGIVAIHVPPSSLAPHQARDKKFYTRLGSHLSPLSKKAILDIMNRQRHPVVRIKLDIILNNRDLTDKRSVLMCTVYNDSGVFCRHFSAIIRLPILYRSKRLHFVGGSGNIEYDSDGKRVYVIEFKNGMNRPLYPHSNRVMSEDLTSPMLQWVEPSEDSEPNEHQIVAIAYADGAIPFMKTYDLESVVRSEGD